MSYGQDIARTYNIPAIGGSGLGQGVGGNANSTSTGGPEIDFELAEGINHLDQGAQEYYRKFEELKGYVHGMWNRYRIDVTKPDFSRGEDGIRAHTLYQKAVADVMHQGQQLTNDQKQLETFQKQRAQGQIVGGLDPRGNVTEQTLGAQTTSLHPMVAEINSRFAKGFETSQERDSAQKDIDQAMSFFEKNRDESETEQQRAYWDQQIATLGDARLSPKIFQPNAKSGDEANPNRVGNRWDYLRSLFTGNVSELRAHPKIDEARMNDDGNKIVLTKSDGKIEIHDIGDQGTWGALNGYIEGMPGNEDDKANSVTNEELRVFEGPSEERLLPDSTFQDVRNNFIESLFVKSGVFTTQESPERFDEAFALLQKNAGNMTMPIDMTKFGQEMNVALIERGQAGLFGNKQGPSRS